MRVNMGSDKAPLALTTFYTTTFWLSAALYMPEPSLSPNVRLPNPLSSSVQILARGGDFREGEPSLDIISGYSQL